MSKSDSLGVMYTVEKEGLLPKFMPSLAKNPLCVQEMLLMTTSAVNFI
jgi:hypothetical protein